MAQETFRHLALICVALGAIAGFTGASALILRRRAAAVVESPIVV